MLLEQIKQMAFTNTEKDPLEIDMSQYPNILTPPSSSEDSPQSIYYAKSPNIQISSPAYFPNNDPTGAPYLRVIEQPVDRFRFRYKSEMTGTHGSLTGINSDKTRKQTYPTVKLYNFNEPAVLRCSIYQHNANNDNMPHAHRLIKKYGKDELDDPHDVHVSLEDGHQHVFHNMGIIHTAKKNLIGELTTKKTKLKKEEIARNEGKHRELNLKEELEIKSLADAESKSINLNIVCLRFDAFVIRNSIFYPICGPVFTHGINNLKSALTGELKIVRMDHCTSPTSGGQEVFILVERVTKKNIRIRFYEVDDEDNLLWEDYGKFSDLDVHHQYAIVFKTPPYRQLDIPSQVKVFIELERPSDRARSDPKEFTYIASTKPGGKRLRSSYSMSSYESSNLPSNELPETLNFYNDNRNLNCNLDHAEFVVNSEELQAAVGNINSDEFNKLFDEFGEEYNSYCNNVIDVPRNLQQREVNNLCNINLDFGKNVSNKISIEEQLLAKRTFDEIEEFLKTKPSNEDVAKQLRCYLGTENKTNGLHIAVKTNTLKILLPLLKTIGATNQIDLLNVKNTNGESLLHIAVECNYEKAVQLLILYKANPTVVDSNLNTLLHTAVLNSVSVDLMEKLLADKNLKKLIDYEDNEGNTPLNLAIENENIKFIKLLYMRGADINQKHKKNGYTPLRFAIEKQHLDIIKHILSLPKTNALIEDFQGINPLQAALAKCTGDILNVISEYMKSKNYSHIEIKKEIEDFSDEEIDQKFDIKLEEGMSVDEIRHRLENMTKFTVECLNQLSAILDQSGSWQNLAELLDLEHLTRSNLFEQSNSKSKLLLNFAIETNGGTVLQIRDFLEHLDEHKAVEIIDKMVTNVDEYSLN